MSSAVAQVPAFVERLRGHGDARAVAGPAGELSYRQLADRVEEVAASLGPVRRLVLVETRNDVAALAGYLGALHGGHVALLADGSDPAQVAELVGRFDPDVVIGADGVVRARRTGSGHRLHPELALLLATSGSTGRPRLVRLSGAALDANAAAIATYLSITPEDCAALTLPMHYCYGLSVINSNLLAGAGVLLSGESVADPAFWAAVRDHGVTSLHGVPYTFELLDRAGFAEMSLPRLRFVTQAGGRMPPEQVRRWARTGRHRGWQLYVMYGQTEATARMAYLPPELAEERPEAVGVPIPGGSITVEAAREGVGELVYRGPNVMLGYADCRSDLARGRTVHALRTGDLGRRRADGLIEVVGRTSRFVKPFGIRTDLDDLERLLAGHGIEAACTGTDDDILVAARVSEPPEGALDERVRTIVADRLGLPASVITAVVVDELPRRPNGKLDHPAVARLGSRPGSRPARSGRPTTVREVFARTFPGHDITGDVSFVDLGGDSLTYVQVSADIERVLGRLPAGWDHLPLGTLETTVAPDVERPGRVTIETGVLLRALAIVTVVGVHAHLWAIVGGAHLLLALSGWTFARFILTADPAPATGASTGRHSLPRRIVHSAARIAVPSMVWITFRALLHNVRFVDILMVGSLVPPLVPGYWFVDTLVQILLVLAVMFALPALRHVEQRHPFGFAAALLAVALVGRWFPTAYGWWVSTDIYSPQVVLWLFVLGWLAHRAVSPAQKWAAAAAVLVLVPTFFGAEVLRSLIVVAGLLLMLFVPTVRLPRAVARVATAVASASLFIYLTHFGVLPLTTLGVPPLLVATIGILLGIASWWAVTAALRFWARRRNTPSRARETEVGRGDRESVLN